MSEQPETATPGDEAAALELTRGKMGESEAIRKQAENWIKGLATLAGLVATVSILKGPSGPSDYEPSLLGLVIILLSTAFLALGIGTFLAYTAAYGLPGRLEEIETFPLPGLEERLAKAKGEQAKAMRKRLKLGVVAGAAGVASLMAASVVTLLPQGVTPPAKTVCIYVGSTKAITVSGSSVNVVSTEPTARIGPCG